MSARIIKKSERKIEIQFEYFRKKYIYIFSGNWDYGFWNETSEELNNFCESLKKAVIFVTSENLNESCKQLENIHESNTNHKSAMIIIPYVGGRHALNC